MVNQAWSLAVSGNLFIQRQETGLDANGDRIHRELLRWSKIGLNRFRRSVLGPQQLSLNISDGI